MEESKIRGDFDEVALENFITPVLVNSNAHCSCVMLLGEHDRWTVKRNIVFVIHGRTANVRVYDIWKIQHILFTACISSRGNVLCHKPLRFAKARGMARMQSGRAE